MGDIRWITKCGDHVTSLQYCQSFLFIKIHHSSMFHTSKKKSYKTLTTRNINNHYEGAEFDLHYREYFSVTEV
jgi:hypothetical protein